MNKAKIDENLIFTAKSKKENSNEQEAEIIAKEIMAELREQYPNLNINFHGYQAGYPEHNIRGIYIFDIWMEPIIFEQEPTTVSSISLNKDIIETQIKSSIIRFIDNMTQNTQKILQRQYPQIEISFDKSIVMNKTPMHFFSFSCPGIIPPDSVSNNPKDTIAIQQLSQEELLEEIQKTIDKYTKKNV